MAAAAGIRVLVVEDDPKTAMLISRGLAEEGVETALAEAGEAALAQLEADSFDAVVLDLMLPGIGGFETCSRARAAGVRTPILMLSARGAVADRISGLETGADDYLAKPFVFAELLARIRALVRRREGEWGEVLDVAGIQLDRARRRAWRGAVELELSAKEFAVLELLMRRAGTVVGREELLGRIWGPRYEQRSNVVDVQVRYLRRKVDVPFGLASIETVRGAGYRLSGGSGP
jgi:two-component system, OmpR family, response regulator